MAVAFVRSHTSVFTKTAGTNNLGVNISTATTPGNVLVARILFDNAATASKPLVSSIAVAAGETNTWVLLGQVNSTSTSAGAFASGAMFAIRTSVAWPVATYAVTLDTSTVMKATVIQEFSDATSTVRSTSGTNYSTTTTAASATTTGTAPVIGDLAVGFIFGSNASAPLAGDTDTTGGAWSAVTNVGSTGSTAATNNFGAAQYKVLTAASHQTLNNSAAMTAGNGAIVAILQQAIPKASMLTDTFDTQIDTAKWDVAGTAVWSAGRAALTDSRSLVYSTLRSKIKYDLVDSAVYVKVTSAAYATNRESMLTAWIDANNSMSMFVGGATGILALRHRSGASNSDEYVDPYDPVAHAWFRIRLVGTTGYYETSPDGTTWTVRRTGTTPLNLSSVTVELACGQWADMGATSTAYFDNVNIVPAPVVLSRNIRVGNAALQRSFTR